MIGLDIKVNRNHTKDLLHVILDGVNFKKYRWHIYADQILYYENDKIEQGIFSNHVLSGEEFIKSISKRGYWFIFVDIKVYKVGNKSDEIETFEDFLTSNCELVFLCTDTVYIEIYCRDTEMLDMIHNNCIGDNFDSVEYVSCDEAAGRNLIAF